MRYVKGNSAGSAMMSMVSFGQVINNLVNVTNHHASPSLIIVGRIARQKAPGRVTITQRKGEVLPIHQGIRELPQAGLQVIVFSREPDSADSLLMATAKKYTRILIKIKCLRSLLLTHDVVHA